jgi:hypothetical protein
MIALPPAATIISTVAPPRPEAPPVTIKLLFLISMAMPIESAGKKIRTAKYISR